MDAKTQIQNHTNYDTTAAAATATSTSAASAATTSTISTDITSSPIQNPSLPTTKLPSRPRKIRKLSPTTASTLTTTINETLKTLSTPSATTKLVPKIVARPLSEDGELDAAISYLRSADPLLIPLIDQHQLPTFDVFQPPFLALTKSILYQQLAYKAGTSIYTRFIALCGGESNVLPDVVLSLTPPQLRQIGVSARKASYLHDLARKYNNGILSDNSIIEMDDKSLFTMLTMVNGIGSWSVHMFMIFSLHRPDVLPIHDTGVRKGVQMLYGLEELPRPSQMEHLCEKWRPYSSVAAWYMWRSVEAKAGPNLNGVNQVARLQQEQQQFLDPINAVLNLGACAWGQ